MSNSPVSRAARVSICIVLLLSLAAVLPREAQAAESWAWPVEGEVLTAYRNGDDPYAAGQHRGIDIGAPVGADVHAATAGTVTFAGTAGSSGLTVSVRTADGRFDTAYLHLDSIDVKAGDAIEAGDVLGSLGTSGRRSAEAPHVHFGVRDAGERHAYHDPLLFLSTPGAPVEPPPAPLVPPSRPAPRPVVAPDPLLSPRPAPAPRGSPGRVPAPSPKGAPSPSPAPAGSPAAEPRPLPGGAARPVARPSSSPGLAQSPSAARSPAPDGAGLRAPVPELGPAPLRPTGAAPQPQAVRPVGSPAPGGGFDLGWALACAGLVVAAVVLIRPGRAKGRPSGSASRLRSARQAQPLTERL